MHLADLLPWLWALAAVVAVVRRRGPGGPAWPWLAGGALLLATLHLWGWNQPVYLAGKNALIRLGVYEQRLAVKFAVALVFFPLVLWLAVRLWRATALWSPLQRVALLAMVLDALYVAIRSLSVDGWMPVWIGVEPGKSLLGAVLAGVALGGIVAARPSVAPSSGPPPGSPPRQSLDTEGYVVRRR